MLLTVWVLPVPFKPKRIILINPPPRDVEADTKGLSAIQREPIMTGILITWLVTTISFLIIARLPFLGIEIDSFGKAVISAGVVGILNAILLPILSFFTLPFIILTVGLFFFILNAIIFGISAAIVPGFRLRYGFWSALLGSITLSIINTIILRLLAGVT